METEACVRCCELKGILIKSLSAEPESSFENLSDSLQSILDKRSNAELKLVARSLIEVFSKKGESELEEKEEKSDSSASEDESKTYDPFSICRKRRSFSGSGIKDAKQYRSIRKSTIFSPVKPLPGGKAIELKVFDKPDKVDANEDNSSSSDDFEVGTAQSNPLADLRQQFDQVDQERLSIEVSQEEKEDTEELNELMICNTRSKNDVITRSGRRVRIKAFFECISEKENKFASVRGSTTKKKKTKALQKGNVNVQTNQKAIVELNDQFLKIDREKLSIENSLYRSGKRTRPEVVPAERSRRVQITI